MVPRARIELALPKKPDFESDASTNSATPAHLLVSRRASIYPNYLNSEAYISK
jgi:hypothetical protein